MPRNSRNNGLPPPTRRKNGFSLPLNKSQICAWIALVATFVEFIIFITPVLPLEASIPFTIVFTGLVGGILYYGGLTQLIDPIDVHLKQHLSSNNRTQQQQRQQIDLPQEEMKQCWICDTQVAEHSMHCKFCNKCVYHFDHHCMCKSKHDTVVILV